MSSKPWYRWFPGDYMHDTVHLSIEEDCLYRRLLDAHWRDGNIPSDPDRIRRLVRFPEAVFDEAWPAVRPFFNKRGGRQNTMVNNRMKSLLDELSRDLTQKVNAAKARWNKKLQADGMRTQCDPDPDPDPEEEKRREEKKSNQKKVPRQSPPTASPVVPDGLCQQSWEAYLKHRRDNRKTKLKQVSVQRLQRWLVEQGDESTQAAIVDETIRNGWTGLFELKADAKPAPAKVKAKTWPIEAYAPWGGIRPEWLEDGPEKDRALEMKALASHTAVREPTDQEAAENQAVVTNLFRR